MLMNILITSIIDLKKSQHNRPHQLIKYLSKNHKITVLSINDWWKGGQENLEIYSKDFNAIFDEIDYNYLTDKKVSPILQELCPSKKIKEILKKDFDVHLNYSTLISGYLASKRINTVYDIADDLSAMIRASPQIPFLLQPFGGYLGDIMIRKNIANSERVTVTTDELIQSCNIPDNKAEVVPNGVDINMFQNYGDTKEELGLEGFVIGYVGVLREWVDLKPVFAALKHLDNKITMVVVGREGDFEGNVNLAKKYGVADRVVFTGMVPYTQVPKYISAMDICLIPFMRGAISENALPLKLFEYMACEKPVITSEIPGIKNAVGNDVVYARNAKEYETKIYELYKNDKLRYDMGKKGRQLVEEKYNWETIVAKLEKILIKTAKR